MSNWCNLVLFKMQRRIITSSTRTTTILSLTRTTILPLTTRMITRNYHYLTSIHTRNIQYFSLLSLPLNINTNTNSSSSSSSSSLLSNDMSLLRRLTCIATTKAYTYRKQLQPYQQQSQQQLSQIRTFATFPKLLDIDNDLEVW